MDLEASPAPSNSEADKEFGQVSISKPQKRSLRQAEVEDGNRHSTKRVRVLDIKATAKAVNRHTFLGNDVESDKAQDVQDTTLSEQVKGQQARQSPDRGTEDSDDEAPEAISLSAAKAQSKSRVAAEGKAAKDRKAQARQARQSRSARLQAQAEQRQRRKKANEPKITAVSLSGEQSLRPNDEIEDTRDQSTGQRQDSGGSPAADSKSNKWAGRRYDLNNIPALLPPELLETEAPERPPTPSTEDGATTSQAKPKPSSFAEKYHEAMLRQKCLGRPVPEITRGPVTVAVLQKRNTLLPPPVENRSKELRGNWARGRPSMLHKSTGHKVRNQFAKTGRVERKVPFAAVKQKFA